MSEEDEQQEYKPFTNGNGSDDDEPKPKRARSGSLVDSTQQEIGPSQTQQPGGEEIVDDEDSYTPKVAKMTTTLKRDVDGYVPGAILKVSCETFLTYDKVSFYPGPYLNFVVGANGTGKSTLACAIAIGLGFPPSTLNRAKHLGSFIKLGANEGTVEVTLKGPIGQKNYVVRHHITKTSTERGSSKFYINGTSATHSDVKLLVERLNVQVGNLCAFLPQDRVASFASLSPKELLVETQKAAGHPKLSSWHQELITRQQELNLVNNNLNSRKNEKTKLEERNQGLEREISRFKDRLQIENRMTVITCFIPYVDYAAAKEEYTNRQNENKVAKANYRRAKQQHEPILKMRELIKQRKQDTERIKQEKKDKYNQNEMDIKRSERTFNETEHRVESLRDELKQLRGFDAKRREQIKNIEGEIEILINETKEKPVREDDSHIKGRMDELQRDMREKKGDLEDVLQLQRELHDNLKPLNDKLDNLEKEIKRLDNVDQQRDISLQNSDPGTWEAVKFIRQHKNKFEDEVFEPVRLMVNVKHRNYASAIENCIKYANSKAIICRSRQDYELLARELNEKRNLRINVVELPNTAQYQLSKMVRPWTKEKMERNGFDSFVIDLFDAPDAIKVFLCIDQYLHRVPVQFHERPIDVSEASHESSDIKRYLTTNSINTIKFSKYGNRSDQTTTRQLRPASIYLPGVNPQVYQKLEDEKTQLIKDRDKTQTEFEKAKYKEGNIRDEFRVLSEEFKSLQGQRERIIGVEKVYHQKLAKLEQLQKRLTSLENQPSELAKRRNIRGKLESLTQKRLGAAFTHKSLVLRANDLMKEVESATFDAIQAAHDLEAFDVEVYQTILDDLQGCEDAIKESNLEMQRAKAKALEHKKTASVSLDNVDPEVAAEVQESVTSGTVLQKSREAYLSELDGLKARLELCGTPNENVIHQYETRKKSIEELRKVIEKEESNKHKIEEKLIKTRQLWYPKLQELVKEVSEMFSSAMDRMGCTGEVRVGEQTEYEKWEMEILVSFRDNEEMQLLTGQRQSGGERSLATVVYLMSLMRLARAPFSLVDEINQGMDQRAERAVHTELVNLTCSDDAAGQCFLITPKLLSGLAYHRRMRCLCINNGEWIPESFNIKSILQRRKQHMVAASA